MHSALWQRNTLEIVVKSIWVNLYLIPQRSEFLEKDIRSIQRRDRVSLVKVVNTARMELLNHSLCSNFCFTVEQAIIFTFVVHVANMMLELSVLVDRVLYGWHCTRALIGCGNALISNMHLCC